MKRKPKNIVAPVCSLESPFSWGLVDSLLLAGCNALEIASRIGLPVTMLYEKCNLEKNCLWSLYSKRIYNCGNSLLKEKQFKLALEGDKAMLLWLGKQRLGQRDTPLLKQDIPTEMKEFMSILRKRYNPKDDLSLEQEHKKEEEEEGNRFLTIEMKKDSWEPLHEDDV